MSTKLQQVALLDRSKTVNFKGKLVRRLSNLWNNFFVYSDKAYGWFVYTIYHYGLQLSIAYGIYSKPPFLMYAWYNMTGNIEEIKKMQ